jgi:hypothetical protein
MLVPSEYSLSSCWSTEFRPNETEITKLVKNCIVKSFTVCSLLKYGLECEINEDEMGETRSTKRGNLMVCKNNFSLKTCRKN